MSYSYYGQPQAEPRRGCGLGCGFWVSLLLILLVGAAGYGYYAYTSYTRAEPRLVKAYALSMSRIALVQQQLLNPAAITPEDLSGAKTDFDTANKEIEAAKNELRFVLPVMPYFGWLPTYGPDIDAVPRMLNMASSLTASATSISSGLEKMVKEISNGSSAQTVVVAGANDLNAALGYLNQADTERNQIDASKLYIKDLRDALSEYDKNVKALKEQIQQFVQGK